MLKWLVNNIVKFLTRIVLKIDDQELKKVPEKGPLLAAANHVNFLDAPVIISHLHPRPTTGLVKKESWDNPLHAFYLMFGAAFQSIVMLPILQPFEKRRKRLKKEKYLPLHLKAPAPGTGE